MAQSWYDKWRQAQEARRRFEEHNQQTSNMEGAWARGRRPRMATNWEMNALRQRQQDAQNWGNAYQQQYGDMFSKSDQVTRDLRKRREDKFAAGLTPEEAAQYDAAWEQARKSGRYEDNARGRQFFNNFMHWSNIRSQDMYDGADKIGPDIKATDLQGAVNELFGGKFEGDIDKFINDALISEAHVGAGINQESQLLDVMNRGGKFTNKDGWAALAALRAANPEFAKQLAQRQQEYIANPELRDIETWRAAQEAKKATEAAPAETAAPTAENVPAAETPPAPTAATPAAPAVAAPTEPPAPKPGDPDYEPTKEELAQQAAAAKAARIKQMQNDPAVLAQIEKEKAAKAQQENQAKRVKYGADETDEETGGINPFLRPEGVPLTPNVTTAAPPSSEVPANVATQQAAVQQAQAPAQAAAPAPAQPQAASPVASSIRQASQAASASATDYGKWVEAQRAQQAAAQQAQAASSQAAAQQASAAASSYGAWVEEQRRKAAAAGSAVANRNLTPTPANPVRQPPPVPQQPQQPKPVTPPTHTVDTTATRNIGPGAGAAAGAGQAAAAQNAHNQEQAARAVSRQGVEPTSTTMNRNSQTMSPAQREKEQKERIRSIIGNRPGLVW
jgi:hypothetical protein